VPPVAGGLALLIAFLVLIGTALRDPHPHDIPVGLVGPPPPVGDISHEFDTNAPGVFRFTTYTSEAAARAALDSRDIDGALVIGGPAPRLIVAGAAGDGVTGVITSAFTNAFKAQGTTVAVEVVHPFAAGDAHGIVLFFVVVAVIISSVVAQAVLFTTARGSGFQTHLAVVIAYAVLAGPIAMGTAQWIAGDYGSGFWSAAGLVTLGSAAVGAIVCGLARLLGRAGFALAALVIVLLDIVSSGGPVGSQLLPDFYRWVAPWLPAGPLYSALRGALYFNGAGVAGPVLVLSGWLAGGLVLMLLGSLVSSRSRAPEASAAPA